MFGALDISVSGLVAQRTRMETISANIANKDAIYDAEGNYSPYRRRIPIFAVGDPSTGNKMGVHVRAVKLDDAPPMPKYQPWHPAADESGMVYYPDIDPVYEKINAMEARRAYEANVTAAEVTKAMLQDSMSLLA